MALGQFHHTSSIYWFNNLPIWNARGIISCIIFHIGLSEPLYYWIHRLLHSSYFFKHYHWLHHSSKVNTPFTAGHATFLEHLLLCVIIGVPIIGTTWVGHGSVLMFYGYILIFDCLRCMGHSNIEVVPHHIFTTIPTLKYLIYTPTYHFIHHKDLKTNFCLFMPLFDILGNTMNEISWDIHREITGSNEGRKAKVPEFVFLIHGVDIMASMQSSYSFRSLSSLPYAPKLIMLPFWPLTAILTFIVCATFKPFLFSFCHLRGKLLQSWAVPKLGFMYFLPFLKDGINKQIEEAILQADKIGVKVLSLAALNKNEALNGGGKLFVTKLPDLKVRVVHGNTLTAAVILNDIPHDVEEVFLTGATSKLGRAIALYLARRKVRVLMLTRSTERFASIQKEAPFENQKFLVQVTTHEAAKHSKYTMERGVVHACHAGGIVHLLENWTHHEVGAIDVDHVGA